MIGIGRHEIALMLKELEDSGVEICPQIQCVGEPIALVKFTYDYEDDVIIPGSVRNVTLIYDERIRKCNMVFRNFLLHEINHAWMIPRKIDYGFSDFLGNAWCKGEVDRVVHMYMNDISLREVSEYCTTVSGSHVTSDDKYWSELEHERCAIFFMMSLSYPDKVREVAPVTFGGLMGSIKSGVFGNVLQDIISKGINSGVTKVDT